MIDYQRQNGADRTLTLDIVDYPGEWLLDLPLLDKTYEQWSAESLALSRQQPRARLAAEWHGHLATLDAKRAKTNRPRWPPRGCSPIICAPAATSALP